MSTRLSRRLGALLLVIGSLAMFALPAGASTGTRAPVFEGTGFIAASDPLLSGGVTGTEWQFWCDGEEPFTQGVDGHVFTLPEAAPTDGGNATLTGDGFEYDLDMWFYDADCASTGDAATTEVDEEAVVPAGTRYVVAVNWLGAGTDATLRVEEGTGGPDPDPTPTPEPTVDPDPNGCTDTPDHVWFLGIAYDSEGRDDFKEDARNFEAFLAKLRESYCISASQATILNMENGYTDPESGEVYREGSEANLKAEIRRMGAEASQYEDSQFFFFLSSHGLMWSGALGGCDVDRVAGSMSALKAGGGEDGSLYDCELGAELNSSFAPTTRMFTAIDCSFCGGFSDSLTAASGTIPDGSVPTSSGIPGPNRIAITGCAITTECFGSPAGGGGVLYRHMKKVIVGETACDGWTAPGFPTVQGFDVPVNGAPLNAPDGICTASEWFFASVWSAYNSTNVQDRAIGIQQQFRIKYGFPSLAEDLIISGGDPGPVAEPTTVAFTESSARAGQYGDEATFAAALVSESGAPIEGAELAFSLANGTDTLGWTATTGADGVATATRALELAPGAYDLSVTYGGAEDTYTPSSDLEAFALDREETATTLLVEGKGKSRTMMSALAEDGGPLGGREIVFYADGTEIARGITDENGVVTLQAPLGYRGDHFTFEARFLGGTNFAGSGSTYQT